MSDKSNNTIIVSHDGLKFGFFKDDAGNGYWTTLSKGRSDYGFGMGCIVPRDYWGDIRGSALSQGIDPALISYFEPGNTKSVMPTKSKIFSGSKTRTVKKIEESGIKIF